MPKQKSKSSVSKRFRKTKNGKVMRGHANTSHFFATKSSKQKRGARQKGEMSTGDAKRFKDVL